MTTRAARALPTDQEGYCPLPCDAGSPLRRAWPPGGRDEPDPPLHPRARPARLRPADRRRPGARQRRARHHGLCRADPVRAHHRPPDARPGGGRDAGDLRVADAADRRLGRVRAVRDRGRRHRGAARRPPLAPAPARHHGELFRACARAAAGVPHRDAFGTRPQGHARRLERHGLALARLLSRPPRGARSRSSSSCRSPCS